MSVFFAAFAIWSNLIGREMTTELLKQPPPTVGVPKNEKPRNVRPWTPPTQQNNSSPAECRPPEKK